MPQIRQHEWFLKNLPADLAEENDPSCQYDDPAHPPQSVEEIMRILEEAKVAGPAAGGGPQYMDGERVDDELMGGDVDDLESSEEFLCAV